MFSNLNGSQNGSVRHGGGGGEAAADSPAAGRCAARQPGCRRHPVRGDRQGGAWRLSARWLQIVQRAASGRVVRGAANLAAADARRRSRPVAS